MGFYENGIKYFYTKRFLPENCYIIRTGYDIFVDILLIKYKIFDYNERPYDFRLQQILV